ncbi:hypothetical protein BsWGS_02687 [Bradybaena similaris]
MTDVTDHARRHSQLQRHDEGMAADTMLSKPEVRPGVAHIHHTAAGASFNMPSKPGVHHTHGGRRWSQFSHSSFSGLSLITRDTKEQPRFQNSYRMGPSPGERFRSKAAEEIMKSVLESYLGGEKYNTSICSSLAKQMSDHIRARMKDVGFSPRYKLVCLVTIGQNKHQGMALASRSVWNPDTDNIASASFANGDLFAVANIYATYFE